MRPLACALLALALTGRDDPVTVQATVETDPVPSAGDAADDPAIWINPDDPSQSRIIGTDKAGGGLAVYAMDGRQIQYIACGKMNNVDLRYGFPLGGLKADIVVSGDRRDDTLRVLLVDQETGRLKEAPAGAIRLGIRVYGSCMYRSARTGKYYGVATSPDGELEQWELFEDGRGGVGGRLARKFRVGGTAEGCAADDELGHLYVAEERFGIWKYGAEPDAGTERTLVDRAGPGGRLTGDVEGLAIYCATNGTGYLLASSQGSSSFAVYRREGGNEYVMSFRIGPGRGIDAVTDCDGIDVVGAALGDRFPRGLFVAQDGRNEGGNQNFKFVRWDEIAAAAAPPLAVDTGWNPRRPRR